MKLFGKKKKQEMEPEQALKAMEGLRGTIEEIDKRSQLLQNKSQNEMQMALQCKKKGDRSGALISLKRRKMYENEISKLEGSRMGLEQQMFAIEAGKMNKNIFESLRSGNEALKQIQGKTTIDQVEKLKEDMENQDVLLHELNDAISQPVGFTATLDDDELMNELNELEAQEYQEGLLEINAPSAKVQPNTVNQPQQHSQSAAQQSNGKELDDLFSEMQMNA